MFLPLAETGIPIITVASGSKFSFNAAAPTRYIQLSIFNMLSIFIAESKAILRSRVLERHVGPMKS